jgi:aspartyl-tRNA(Asn)/glutamyl-tRNA(Gln) amidotransferase subunit A
MPNDEDLLAFDVATLAAKFRAKELSPVEVTEAYLARIAVTDERVRAYITVTADVARDAARTAEAEISSGKWRGPLHGVPVALKDLCYTRDIRTTGGSKILADFVPSFDSTVWARLKAAGAVLLGKLNLHEFACGATNTNPHWGICRNPYDLDCIPGGSSGGSAAAIVARLAAATIGTDTGGSIRIPAAFCGCVGLKQTWSRVSRYGVIPLSDSLDHVGPITRSARDAALMLSAIAGHDASDSTSSREAVPDYAAAITGGIKRIRVGVVKELTTGLDSTVANSFDQAIRTLASLGAGIDQASIPSLPDAAAIATTITFAEAAEYHENWLRTRPSDYGFEVRRALEAGLMMPALHYVRAQRFRAIVLAEALAAYEQFDVLAAPTAAIPAPLIAAGHRPRARKAQPSENDSGGKSRSRGDEPVDLVASVLRFTAPFNVTGQPAIAVPAGLSSDGLPLSIQLIGRPFDEATVLNVADSYEMARGALPPPRISSAS